MNKEIAKKWEVVKVDGFFYKIVDDKGVGVFVSSFESDINNRASDVLLASSAREMLEMLQSCALAFEQIGMQKPEGLAHIIERLTK